MEARASSFCFRAAGPLESADFVRPAALVVGSPRQGERALEAAGARFAFVASLAGLLPSYSYAAHSSSKYGIVGLAGTLNVETAAREILAGLARGQFLVIPGGRAKLTQALDRFVLRSMSHRIADIVVSSALRDAEHD